MALTLTVTVTGTVTVAICCKPQCLFQCFVCCFPAADPPLVLGCAQCLSRAVGNCVSVNVVISHSSLQGAQPAPSHRPPDGKCQPQWHL